MALIIPSQDQDILAKTVLKSPPVVQTLSKLQKLSLRILLLNWLALDQEIPLGLKLAFAFMDMISILPPLHWKVLSLGLSSNANQQITELSLLEKTPSLNWPNKLRVRQRPSESGLALLLLSRVWFASTAKSSQRMEKRSERPPVVALAPVWRSQSEWLM